MARRRPAVDPAARSLWRWGPAGLCGVAALAGIAAARAGWHRALGLEVAGWEYAEARLLAAALGAGALAAFGAALLGRRALWLLAAAGGLGAMGAAVRHGLRIEEAGRTIAEVLAAVDLAGPGAPGGRLLGAYWIAAAAALLQVLAALGGWIGERRGGRPDASGAEQRAGP
ncbi:MAG: hypothetical protein KatS3mg102_1778 [Planctomycetota bacterium]|nr:MAG: hypothetical protein KatS3mg102_1778 [Planctomycetota bacterium]